MNLKTFPVWIKLFGLAIIVGGIFSIFASKNPDGLIRVSIDKGFSVQQASLVKGFFPNYGIPGVSPAWLAKGLAGFLGTLFVFGIVFGIAQIINRTKKSSSQKR